MVKIDVTKPIRRMIQALGPHDQELPVMLKYERLPNFCYFCVVIGHLVKDCPDCIDLANGFEIPENMLAYGYWLHGTSNAQPSRFVNGSLQSFRTQSQGRRANFAS